MRTRMTKRDQLIRIVDEYRAEHDNSPATSREMGDWAVETRRYKLPPFATQRRCAEELSEVMGLDMFTAPSGRRVRRMHAWRDQQRTLWDNMNTITRDNMSLALAYRRNTVVGEVKQMKIDLDYFNDLHPDDLALQMSFNLENDLADAGLLNFSSSEPGQPSVPPPGVPPRRGSQRGPSRPSSRPSGPVRRPPDSSPGSPEAGS